MAKPRQRGKQIPIIWDSAQRAPTVYANQLAITHSSGEFYLVFGEAQIPIVVNQTDRNLPDQIKIREVARIAVSPDMIVQFAAVISDNVNRYMQHIEEEANDE